MNNTENENIIVNKGGFKKGYTPFNKGIPNTDEQKKKISISLTGKKKTATHAENISKGKMGWKMPEEGKIKLSIINTGKVRTEESKIKQSITNIKLGIKPPVSYGKDHPNYIEDRTQVDMNKRRNHSTECIEWREKIFKRDDYVCKDKDENCKGQLQAHHIKSWREYPELRFIINNGITLCVAHHPRKRAEEKRLESYFMELVSVSEVFQLL